MERIYYRVEAVERRRMLADAGFVRHRDRTWSHPDGRSIGEGVAMALADLPFFRFLGVDPTAVPPEMDSDDHSSVDLSNPNER